MMQGFIKGLCGPFMKFCNYNYERITSMAKNKKKKPDFRDTWWFREIVSPILFGVCIFTMGICYFPYPWNLSIGFIGQAIFTGGYWIWIAKHTQKNVEVFYVLLGFFIAFLIPSIVGLLYYLRNPPMMIYPAISGFGLGVVYIYYILSKPQPDAKH
jgi:hypothetical protein